MRDLKVVWKDDVENFYVIYNNWLFKKLYMLHFFVNEKSEKVCQEFYASDERKNLC